MLDKNKILVKRLQVKSASSQQIVENRPGIICVGVASDTGEASVLLLWDEADANPACSLTNGVESVLGYLYQAWATEFPWKSCIAVERDSLGEFDILCLDSGGDIRFSGWSGARWPGCDPRSWRAVEAMLGTNARIARETVLSVQQQFAV